MLHSTNGVHTFFSSKSGTFLKINHVLSHEASIKKFQGIATTQTIFSDHNAIKIEVIT